MTKLATKGNPGTSAQLKTRLSKAKTSLILDHTFFGTLAMNMPFELVPEDDPRITTAATDGKTVWFNEAFVGPLSDPELLFLVAHEVCHPMFDHNGRRGDRDPKLWNMAADYVINELLVNEKIGQMIEGGCYDPALYKAGRGISEGIYDLLQRDDKGGKDGKFGHGGNTTGSAYDEVMQSGQTEAERSQQAAEWKVKVAQAAQAAKMMGKLSANVARLVDDTLQSKVDWRDVLRNFIVRSKNESRTWARPNRRFITQGLYLPSVDGEATGELVIAIDCSGSVGDDDLNRFAAECKAIKTDLNPAAMHVVYFDHAVCHYDRFGPDDELVINAHGGGGTAFSPVFKYLAENNIEPMATVFLTDLYCDDFGDAPGHPVLWVTYGTDRAPWGEVVKM